MTERTIIWIIVVGGMFLITLALVLGSLIQQKQKERYVEAVNRNLILMQMLGAKPDAETEKALNDLKLKIRDILEDDLK